MHKQYTLKSPTNHIDVQLVHTARYSWLPTLGGTPDPSRMWHSSRRGPDCCSPSSAGTAQMVWVLSLVASITGTTSGFCRLILTVDHSGACQIGDFRTTSQLGWGSSAVQRQLPQLHFVAFGSAFSEICNLCISCTFSVQKRRWCTQTGKFVTKKTHSLRGANCVQCLDLTGHYQHADEISLHGANGTIIYQYNPNYRLLSLMPCTDSLHGANWEYLYTFDTI
jgi:hypothetical protein